MSHVATPPHGMSGALFVGLMSGTSLDGVDGVVIDLDPRARCRVLAHAHAPFAPALREALLDLNQSGIDEIHRAALAANALARDYAGVVQDLLHRLDLPPTAITAIGAHGQTVRHRPGEFDATGYTCQLLNGALLAELTGIDVVCDFRNRDVAAGGQGAPLVPAFHRAVLAQSGNEIAVLNLGGMANLSLLHADGRTTGHDCGPGNVLMDAWCQQHTGHQYDDDGQWAAAGRVSDALLDQLLGEPFLKRKPPKSTGRDLFSPQWLRQQLQTYEHRHPTLPPPDVQATLARFTARTVADDLALSMPAAQQLIVCGGGALNKHLLGELRAALPVVNLQVIQQVTALQPMQVEAAAFGWLAQQLIHRRPGNCTDVTGAKGARLLGAIYPA